MINTAVLLIQCPDQKGIVAKTTEFLVDNGANILDLHQHVDSDEQYFYMRLEWDLEQFVIPKPQIHEYFTTLIGKKFQMQSQLYFSGQRQRLAIFVSKYSHCIYDILARVESGEWDVDVVAIVSNHEKLKSLANRHAIPFYHFPKTKENKVEQEKLEINLMKELNTDLIVLARYMQILTDQFTSAFPNQIINIHHSSLPAFAGSDPYRAASRRGVKFIGATSHYVTPELDAGPIIAQDVIPISHVDSLAEMKRKGRDIEKITLARAIWAHLNHKILVYDNKTVVFQ